jgi:hypothetical protein
MNRVSRRKIDVARATFADHAHDEIQLAAIASRYGVENQDDASMWHDLALLLARRYEENTSFRIPWNEGDVDKLKPGRKLRPDKKILAATKIQTYVRAIQKRASWNDRDLKTAKIVRRGLKLNIRKACLVAALIEAGAAKSEKYAIAMVIDDRVPRHKKLPDVYSRYQRSVALIGKLGKKRADS